MQAVEGRGECRSTIHRCRFHASNLNAPELWSTRTMSTTVCRVVVTTKSGSATSAGHFDISSCLTEHLRGED